MHHYSHHIGDYRRDTGHLSLLEHGIYRQLLDTYYLDEAPIPNRFLSLCRRLSAKSEVEKEAVKAVVKEFFVLQDGAWHHAKCDKLIEKYRHRREVNSSNGKQGGRGNRKATEKRTESESLTKRKATNNHKPRTKEIPPLPPEGEVWWSEFWQAYPRKEGKPDARRAFGKALTRAASFEALMAGLRRYIGCDQWTADETKIPHPATWLNRDGWNDTPAKAGGQTGQNGATGAWWTSGKGVEAKGIELGLPGPPDASVSPQEFIRYKASVWVAAGDGPWWDQQDTAYRTACRLRDGSL